MTNPYNTAQYCTITYFKLFISFLVWIFPHLHLLVGFQDEHIEITDDRLEFRGTGVGSSGRKSYACTIDLYLKLNTDVCTTSNILYHSFSDFKLLCSCVFPVQLCHSCVVVSILCKSPQLFSGVFTGEQVSHHGAQHRLPASQMRSGFVAEADVQQQASTLAQDWLRSLHVWRYFLGRRTNPSTCATRACRSALWFKAFKQTIVLFLVTNSWIKISF